MDSRFEAWLLASGYDAVAAKSRLSNLRRVESANGDLDSVYRHDRFSSLQAELGYSTSDAARSAPNPSRTVIDGDLRTGVATLRSAVKKYTRFQQEVARVVRPEQVHKVAPAPVHGAIAGNTREPM